MPPSPSRGEPLRSSNAPALPQKKSVACRPCHARKIRCSGKRPCNNCTRVADCIFPTRDRQVRVHQSYLDRILQENAELRALQTRPQSPQLRRTNDTQHQARISDVEQDPADHQMVEESDWFAHTRASNTPIWISEITDSAFATRFRQFAFCFQVPPHIPRTQFASDDVAHGLMTSSPAWPLPRHARHLVETALQFLQHSYHIVRRSEVLAALRMADLSQAGSRAGHATRAKLWALFALGELRSRKCPAAANSFPGLGYFAAASNAIRMVCERPQLDVIETIMLLALYSLETNRRHSASTFAASALRVATVMGLHVNIGHAFIPDPELREHRVRVWWSIYTLDRFLSSKIGLPLLIADDDIAVDLPSTNDHLNAEDFGDPSQLVAVVRLAKIAGNISRSLYVRIPRRCTFLQRVAKVREELEKWMEQLPDPMKLCFNDIDGNESNNPPGSPLLQLSFNQLFIVATRPVLLFVFRRYVDGRTASAATTTAEAADTTFPKHARDIAGACIQCARKSCRILSTSWVTGDFHIFDYCYVQYLFSAAVVLAIAGTLGWEKSTDDHDEFLIAAEFLQQLEDIGNPGAMEFNTHVKEIQSALESLGSICRPQNASVSSQDPILQSAGKPSQSSLGNEALEQVWTNDSGHGAPSTDELPLNLSFLDDWIYENALEQLCWEEQ